MNKFSLIIFAGLLVGGSVVFGGNSAHAQTAQPAFEEKPIGYPNWQLPTFGGSQFWTDVRYVGGWRIQRNSETGHHRLLDADSTRHAWGNLAHCNQELDARVNAGTVQPNQGKIVFTIHGLIRSNNCMTTIGEYLQQQGQYSIVNFEYASTRATVETHAADLRSVIDGLGPNVTEINFVCHSLGNIVVRCYLGDANPAQALSTQSVPAQFPAAQIGTHLRVFDPRIVRMVMLGPPNHGSRMARIMHNSFAFQAIAGDTGTQLGVGWELLEPKLATPSFEFGIIAGGQPDESNYNNVLLKGPDDFTVSLEEAKLAGAHDLLVRPLRHGAMLNEEEVHQATLQFLQRGFFVSAQQRQPIPLETADRK